MTTYRSKRTIMATTKIEYVHMELFGRQLSDNETQRAIILLNEIFNTKGAQVVHGDLFALYAKPFVGMSSKEGSCIIWDRATDTFRMGELIDLQRLVYDFYIAVCDTYRRHIAVAINNSNDPSFKTSYENVRRRLGISVNLSGLVHFKRKCLNQHIFIFARNSCDYRNCRK